MSNVSIAQHSIQTTSSTFNYNSFTQSISQNLYSQIYLMDANLSDFTWNGQDLEIIIGGSSYLFSKEEHYEQPSLGLDFSFYGEFVNTSTIDYIGYSEKNGYGIGDVKFNGDQYTILMSGGESFLLKVAYGDDGCGSEEDSSEENSDYVDPENCWEDFGCSITILPLYTQNSIPSHVSQQNLGAYISTHSWLNFQYFKRALLRSNIFMSPELLTPRMTSWSESGNDINALEQDIFDNIPNDPLIQSERMATGADLVIVFTHDYDGVNGIAEGINDDPLAEYYHAIVETASTPNYTFTHELGHLLSARHQFGVIPPEDPRYTYAHAHFMTSAMNDVTLMGVNINTPIGPTNYSKILHFSNPAVDWMGLPTGIIDGPNYNDPTKNHNNACAINGRHCRVAQFNSSFGSIIVNLEPHREAHGSYILCAENSSGLTCLDVSTTGTDPGMDWYRVEIFDDNGVLIGSPHVRSDLNGATSDQFCSVIDLQLYYHSYLTYCVTVVNTSGDMHSDCFTFYFCKCTQWAPDYLDCFLTIAESEKDQDNEWLSTSHLENQKNGEILARLIPNPSLGMVPMLEFEGIILSDFEVSIHDSGGRVLSEKRISYKTNAILLDELINYEGLFWVRIKYGENILSLKGVK